jgi:hypothetical protein
MDSNDPSDRKKPTPLQKEAWIDIYLENRPVVEVARELKLAGQREIPQEVPPWMGAYGTAIQGLLRLCPQGR